MVNLGTVGQALGGMYAAYTTHVKPQQTAKKVAAVWACWTALFASYAAAVVVLTDKKVNHGIHIGGVFVALSAAMLGGAIAAIATTNISTTLIKYLAVGAVVMEIVLYAATVLYRKFFASNQEPLPFDTFADPILVFVVYFAGTCVAGASYYYFQFKAEKVKKVVVQKTQATVQGAVRSGTKLGITTAKKGLNGLGDSLIALNDWLFVKPSADAQESAQSLQAERPKDKALFAETHAPSPPTTEPSADAQESTEPAQSPEGPSDKAHSVETRAEGPEESAQSQDTRAGGPKESAQSPEEPRDEAHSAETHAPSSPTTQPSVEAQAGTPQRTWGQWTYKQGQNVIGGTAKHAIKGGKVLLNAGAGALIAFNDEYVPNKASSQAEKPVSAGADSPPVSPPPETQAETPELSPETQADDETANDSDHFSSAESGQFTEEETRLESSAEETESDSDHSATVSRLESSAEETESDSDHSATVSRLESSAEETESDSDHSATVSKKTVKQ